MRHNLVPRRLADASYGPYSPSNSLPPGLVPSRCGRKLFDMRQMLVVHLIAYRAVRAAPAMTSRAVLLTIAWAVACMHHVRLHLSSKPGTFLAEIVSPRDIALDALALENLLQALCLTTQEPVALELFGTLHARRLLVRATTSRSLAHICAQLRAHLPQAEVRTLVSTPSMQRAPTGGVRVQSQGMQEQQGMQRPAEELAPLDDPLCIATGERVRSVVLRPRAGSHLPLKLYEQHELAGVGVDPLLGVLAAMDGLPPGGRVVAHLGLAAAPDSWSRPLQRMAVEHPLAQERAQEALRARSSSGGGGGGAGATSMTSAGAPPLFPLLVLLGGVMATSRWGTLLVLWWNTRDVTHLARVGAISAVALLLLASLLVVRARFMRHDVYDMRLVEVRTARIAARASLVLVAAAPPSPVSPVAPVSLVTPIRSGQTPAALLDVSETDRRLDDVLTKVVAAYRQHALASGNGFIPCHLSSRRARCLVRRWSGWARHSRFLLNARELAALWHPPAGDADVPLIERTRAKTLLAPALPLSSGHRVGVSTQAGHSVPVRLPSAALHHNALLVAKTGKGKSSLLHHLALAALSDTSPSHGAHPTASHMEPDDPAHATIRAAIDVAIDSGFGSRMVGQRAQQAQQAQREQKDQMGLVVVDPHGDLATSLLGLIPAARRDDVVLVDLADTAYPVALNPLDALLGRDRDKAVESLLQILSQIWARFWGPRMQNALEYALKTLYEANETLVATDPQHGPDQQFTLLDVAPVLSAPGFRRDVLTLVHDQALHTWWTHYYKPLDPRLQLEIINPVLTKMAAFSGSRVARRIVGQGRSTLDLAEIVRDGKVLLVNTAKGVVGAETATLVGATLLGTLHVSLEEQARLVPEERRHFLVVVDEFQSILGVDYGAMLSELRKFGGTFALASQTLAHLDALDPGLRPTVLANVDALYAFASSAEDACVLARELDDAVTVTDLINLDDYCCYAKLTLDGHRLPVFSLALDPPTLGNEQTAHYIRGRARTGYAHPLEAVEEVLATAAARYLPPHEMVSPGSAPVAITHDPTTRRPPTSPSSRAPQAAPAAPAAGQNSGDLQTGADDSSRGSRGLTETRTRGRRGRFGRRTLVDRPDGRAARLPLVEMSDLWADLTNQLTGDLTPQSSGVLPGAAFSNGDSGGGRDRGDSEKTPGLPVKPEAASVKDIPVEFAAAEDEADEDNEAGTAP